MTTAVEAFTVGQLQREQVAWTEHNFGTDRTPHHPLLGICEELGELREACRGWDHEAIEDAIHDAVIYVTDYASSLGLDIDACVARVKPNVVPVEPVIIAGKLCHHRLKWEQGIRGTAEYHREQTELHLGMLVNSLRCLARDLGLDFERGLARTAAYVFSRDFVKYPGTGFPPGVPHPAPVDTFGYLPARPAANGS